MLESFIKPTGSLALFKTSDGMDGNNFQQESDLANWYFT
jgi:hypothetical protein